MHRSSANTQTKLWALCDDFFKNLFVVDVSIFLIDTVTSILFFCEMASAELIFFHGFFDICVWSQYIDFILTIYCAKIPKLKSSIIRIPYLESL